MNYDEHESNILFSKLQKTLENSLYRVIYVIFEK